MGCDRRRDRRQTADIPAGAADADALVRSRLADAAHSDAPPVPPAVTDAVLRALREASTRPPAADPDVAPVSSHTGASTRSTRLTRAAAAAGALAVAGIVALGVAALSDTGDDVPADTAIPASPTVGFSDAEISALVQQPPSYGRLGDPLRRAACLRGLGFPADTPLLGARSVERDGSAAVVLVVPDGASPAWAVLVVRPDCTAADTGLLAQTTVGRP